jgi:thymidylate synthase (FAD)
MSNDYLKGHESKCLDHGFVRVVDLMGDDAAIVQAARVSYGIGTKAKSEDRGLIRYLMRHWHTTPFEMCEIKLHVKLPVFVARQWIRHRTANVNEYSARYSILDNEFYIPEVDDILPQSTTNKQGRDGSLPEVMRHAMRETINQHSQGAYQVYAELMHGWPWLNERGEPTDEHQDGFRPHEEGLGMARELARMVLPVNVYTQWYWKVDLHNLFHFLRLRADPHAQMEIRVYANAICEIVKAWCPMAYEAFEDYRLHAVTLSRQEVAVMRILMAHNPSTFRHALEWDHGMSDREAKDFLNTFLPEPKP